MRYRRQKPRASHCGPLAIYNAMVCLKRKGNLKQLEQDTKCHSKLGTRLTDITHTLAKHGIKAKHVRRVKMPYIIKELQKGSIIIYLYQYAKGNGHYTLFTGTTKKVNTVYLKTVNDCDFCGWETPVQNVTVKYYNKKAQRWAGSVFRRWRERLPQAWIIRKPKK